MSALLRSVTSCFDHRGGEIFVGARYSSYEGPHQCRRGKLWGARGAGQHRALQRGKQVLFAMCVGRGSLCCDSLWNSERSGPRFAICAAHETTAHYMSVCNWSGYITLRCRGSFASILRRELPPLDIVNVSHDPCFNQGFHKICGIPAEAWSSTGCIHINPCPRLNLIAPPITMASSQRRTAT